MCFFFQAEDGIRYLTVTGVQTCALPISCPVAPFTRLGPPSPMNDVPSTMKITSDSAGRYAPPAMHRSEEHTSELQSQSNLVCRLLLEKKNETSHRGLDFDPTHLLTTRVSLTTRHLRRRHPHPV